MQIKSLHKNIYKLYAYARTQESLDAVRQHHSARINRWKAVKSEGLSDAACARLSGVSRASYYRSCRLPAQIERGIAPPSKARKRQNPPRWGEKERQLVLTIRRANPTYGRDKIVVIVRRDHACPLSPSTVGRILIALKNKGLVTASPSRLRIKRTRNFEKGHARQWSFKKYEEFALGERLQVDHMTVTKNGISFKHFQSWERTSKHIHAQLYGDATSRSAAKFLDELIKHTPYTILSIQVDGGSEFRADFEQACADRGIPLIVLPPAKPTYNGGAERGNRTFREEFYQRHDLLADSLGALRYALTQAVTKYNDYRPYKKPDGLTPNQYLKNTLQEPA